jgi:hypothetical protein
MRRQAGIGALLLICVGIVLGATVFRSDIAQATGLAQSVTVNNTPAQAVPVTQQGTATVRVTNERTQPLPTSDVNAPARTPVKVATRVDVQAAAVDLYTVPSGKRLVLEYIDAGGVSAVGPIGARFDIRHPDFHDPDILNFPLTVMQFPTPPAFQEYAMSEEVTIYLGAGETIEWRGGANPSGYLDINLYGYLVDAA